MLKKLPCLCYPAGQRSIKAESAAIIYAMDPVYAAGFSFLLLGVS